MMSLPVWLNAQAYQLQYAASHDSVNRLVVKISKCNINEGDNGLSHKKATGLLSRSALCLTE